jgi:hypothetical protein
LGKYGLYPGETECRTVFTPAEPVGEGTAWYHWLGMCWCGAWEKEGPFAEDVGSGAISLSGVLVVEEYWWGDWWT